MKHLVTDGATLVSASKEMNERGIKISSVFVGGIEYLPENAGVIAGMVLNSAKATPLQTGYALGVLANRHVEHSEKETEVFVRTEEIEKENLLFPIGMKVHFKKAASRTKKTDDPPMFRNGAEMEKVEKDSESANLQEDLKPARKRTKKYSYRKGSSFQKKIENTGMEPKGNLCEDLWYLCTSQVHTEDQLADIEDCLLAAYDGESLADALSEMKSPIAKAVKVLANSRAEAILKIARELESARK